MSLELRAGAGDLPGGHRLPGMPGTFSAGFEAPAVLQRPIPAELRRVMRPQQEITGVFELGECSVIISREPPHPGAAGPILWHLSISHPLRHPSWDEIKFARYRLLPDDIEAAIFLPPRRDYVNVPAQDHVFHVWEAEQ